MLYGLLSVCYDPIQLRTLYKVCLYFYAPEKIIAQSNEPCKLASVLVLFYLAFSLLS